MSSYSLELTFFRVFQRNCSFFFYFSPFYQPLHWFILFTLFFIFCFFLIVFVLFCLRDYYTCRTQCLFLSLHPESLLEDFGDYMKCQNLSPAYHIQWKCPFGFSISLVHIYEFFFCSYLQVACHKMYHIDHVK